MLGVAECECVRSASSSRASSAARFSIMVSSSASSTKGRVMSRTSREPGAREGKNRWKKMVCSIPIFHLLRTRHPDTSMGRRVAMQVCVRARIFLFYFFLSFHVGRRGCGAFRREAPEWKSEREKYIATISGNGRK